MEEDGWEEMPADVAELVAIGGEVEVRVHRLRNPRYFRFPIQVCVAVLGWRVGRRIVSAGLLAVACGWRARWAADRFMALWQDHKISWL
jgi:hypothetical protein